MNSYPVQNAGTLTTPGWLVYRFIPVLIIVTILSVVAAWIRSKNFFIPGIQGMIIGGISGWIAGILSRKDIEKFQTFSQRIWLSLSMSIGYSVAHLVSLSVFNAGIIDPPLYWLGKYRLAHHVNYKKFYEHSEQPF